MNADKRRARRPPLAGMVSLVVLGTAVALIAVRHHQTVTAEAVDPSAWPEPGTAISDTLRSGGAAPAVVVVPAGQLRTGEPIDGSRAHQWLTTFAAVVPRPFAVARTETTVASFRHFVEQSGTRVEKGCWDHTEQQDWKFNDAASWSSPGFAQTDNHPVTCVTYEDAVAYAAWLSEETRQRYRLPTEVEAEYFNRGGRNGIYSFDLDHVSELCGKANGADRSTKFAYAYSCDDGYQFTAPVGSFAANGFGLYDTTGNLWELTADCWHSDYVRALSHLAGAGSSGSWLGGCHARHVIRGGSYISSSTNLKIAKRDVEGYRSTRVGFRVVRDLTP